MLKKSGQSLIELLIAIGLTAILLPALLTAVVASSEGRAQSQQRTEATNLQKEAEEALRSIRETNWQQINTNGTFHPVISGSNWTLAAGPEDINGYTRKIEIQDAQRDAGGNIAASGTVDPSTKKVTTTVSWTTPLNSQVDSTAYFSRYLGNNNIGETTQAQFTAGIHTNTQAVNNAGGEVELTQSPSSTSDYGNKFWTRTTSAIGSMTRVTGKTSLRFTAQNTKSVSAVRVYVNTKTGNAPTYRLGIQTNNPAAGNIPSGTWVGGQGTLTNPATGWQTSSTLTTAAALTAGQIYHLVVESTGAGGNGSISLRRSAPLNPLYPQTQASDTMANTLYTTTSFSIASIQNSQPIYELDFNDTPQTFEGNPFYTSQVSTISGDNWFGEKFTVTGGDKTVTKITFLVSRNASGTSRDDLYVELRDAATNTTIEEGIIARTNTATIYTDKFYTFTTPRVLTSGNTYRIILKSPGSIASNAYRIYRIGSENSANFNSINYDGTNSIFTSSGNAGSTWADSYYYLDVGRYFFTVTAPGGYAASGTFQSQTKNAGSSVAFNNIKWVATTPIGTALQIQVATSPSPGGPWEFFGADGVIGSYFTAPGPIPLNRINGQYLLYKILFTSNGVSTPTLSEINFNYSP